jgi:hypothetical protein
MKLSKSLMVTHTVLSTAARGALLKNQKSESVIDEDPNAKGYKSYEPNQL